MTLPFRLTWPVLVICVSIVLGPPARAQRRLSLHDAITLARAQSPQLRLEAAKVDEARAQRKGTRGLYGPKLMSEGNLLYWDSEQKFTFAMPDVAAMDLSPTELATLVRYSDLLLLLPNLLELGNIRDQLTAQLRLTLAQPLTPLLQVHQGHRATALLEQAAVDESRAKVVDVVYKVKESYLQLMQAQRFGEVASTGVEQVKQHLKQARQYYEAGLIGKQEVLKAQLELARAEERLIKARYGASLASSALALQLGLPLDEKLMLTERLSDPPPPPPVSLEQSLRRAVDQRDELAAMTKRQAAAEADHKRQLWQLVPQISAIASYQYTHGQGTFMPANAFFVGGMLQWDLWDWGSTYYTAQAAEAKAAQALIGQRLLRDGVLIQTKKAYLDLQQSAEELSVARVAIKEAEENFRIETTRFEANANTSTDVLDAQLALTRANLSYTTSLYGYYIALAGLERAMGQQGSASAQASVPQGAEQQR